MNTIPFEALCKRFGVPFAALDPLPMKRALAAKLLRSHKSPTTPALLEGIDSFSESFLDRLIESLGYDQAQELFNPKRKRRRRSAERITRYADIEEVMRANGWSAEKAAREVFPRYEDRYRTAESLANAHLQERKPLERMQRLRDQNAPDIFMELAERYIDVEAGGLCARFCVCIEAAKHAEAVGNEALLREARLEAARIIETGHPLILGVVCARWLSVSDVWQLAGRVLREFQGEDQEAPLIDYLRTIGVFPAQREKQRRG